MEKVDYDYYSNNYCGNIIPPADFNKVLLKAEAYVDGLIFGRDPGDREESVKLAICNVAELLYLDDERHGIVREDSDGYSVSYLSSELDKDIASAVAVYLADSGLMYAGGR